MEHTLKSSVVIVQTQVFYGTSCLFSKRGKIGHKATCAESGPNRTFEPSLDKADTTVHMLSGLGGQNRIHFLTRNQTETDLTREKTGQLLSQLIDKFSMLI